MHETSLALDRSLGGAGDIWPTFVTPETAKLYIDELSENYRQLDRSIQNSPVVQTEREFLAAWLLHAIAFWKFVENAYRDLSFLNAKAIMEQTDRWYAQFRSWRDRFTALGGQAPPVTPPPGQGMPTPPSADLAQIASIVTIVGGVAALLIILPRLTRN